MSEENENDLIINLYGNGISEPQLSTEKVLKTYEDKIRELSNDQLTEFAKSLNQDSSREINWVVAVVNSALENRGLEKIEISKPQMKMFYLNRVEDVTGVSGTGVVGEGIQFSDGSCVVRWTSSTPTTTFYRSMKDVQSIHSHNGATEIVWID